jgi:carbamoyltransferase
LKILGVNVSHDAAAALIVDGEIVACAAEERFNRIKHYGYMPVEAVRYCLEAGGIEMGDLDYIASTVSVLDPGLILLFQLDEAAIEQALRDNDYSRFSWENLRYRLSKKLHRPAIPPNYVKLFNKSPHTHIIRVDHHAAHAAAAYYTSGYKERNSLIITSDGVGDGTSIAIWRPENGRLKNIRRYGTAGSLGFFYAVVTEALGWWVGDGEGKTMGLAPYGNPEAFPDAELDIILPHFREGELIKPIKFEPIGLIYLQDTSHWHFLSSEKIKNVIDRRGREDVAAKAQKLLEEEMVPLVQYWVQKEGATHVATAGGVFLNVKMNQRIIESRMVEQFHIYPDAGDAGLAVGAALEIYHARSGDGQSTPIQDTYWGPSYSKGEIESALRTRNIPYCGVEDIGAECAALLAKGKIVGWFQGRMEAGPRALGGRSILMDPRRAENKDIINARVKYREAFRPFCPSITAEAARRYFKIDREERYMICSYGVNGRAVAEIPAVVHVDQTVRPQVVRPSSARYYRLIEEFDRLTGVPALLNTSFNIKGEPIVCSPSDAIKCFFDTGMDVLAMEDFLISKS